MKASEKKKEKEKRRCWAFPFHLAGERKQEQNKGM
jgi:hypothetical protein